MTRSKHGRLWPPPHWVVAGPALVFSIAAPFALGGFFLLAIAIVGPSSSLGPALVAGIGNLAVASLVVLRASAFVRRREVRGGFRRVWISISDPREIVLMDTQRHRDSAIVVKSGSNDRLLLAVSPLIQVGIHHREKMLNARDRIVAGLRLDNPV